MNQLFEDITFVENPLYEKIIEDIISQQYSIVEGFFTENEVMVLRQSLLCLLYTSDAADE